MEEDVDSGHYSRFPYFSFPENIPNNLDDCNILLILEMAYSKYIFYKTS